MDAKAEPVFDTRLGVIVGRMRKMVAVRLDEEGITLAPVAGGGWAAGQRVEVLLRKGYDRALAVRATPGIGGALPMAIGTALWSQAGPRPR